jgi:excisionase family DNA binding protein
MWASRFIQMTIVKIASIQKLPRASDSVNLDWMSDDAPAFLGTTAAARMLGLSTTMIQSLVDHGELQGWKTRGGHRRVSVQSIDDYRTRVSLDVGAHAKLKSVPRVMVVVESIESLDRLRGSSAAWSFPLKLQFVDSITEALLILGSVRPDFLLLELAMPKHDQEKVVMALETFKARGRAMSTVVMTIDADWHRASDAVHAVQLVYGKLSDAWLHAYLMGVVSAWQI